MEGVHNEFCPSLWTFFFFRNKKREKKRKCFPNLSFDKGKTYK